jgi:hypothetical protein
VTTWIVNASPLILLGKINRLELLAALAPSFVIPAAVLSEILAGPDLDPARTWVKSAYASAHVYAAQNPAAFLPIARKSARICTVIILRGATD